LTPYRHGGVYLNFMGEAEAQARVADAFAPEVYQRLLAVKHLYDPDNRFRFAYQLSSQR
jgi:FAD/FMN-containing dehydrogenase